MSTERLILGRLLKIKCVFVGRMGKKKYRHIYEKEMYIHFILTESYALLHVAKKRTN